MMAGVLFLILLLLAVIVYLLLLPPSELEFTARTSAYYKSTRNITSS